MLGLIALLPMALPASYPTVPMKGIGGKDLGMPLVGLGTWQYNSSVAEAAVKLAFSLGYRHVDTALGYGNQDGVGRGLAAASAAAGLKRADYFVTSKIPGGLNTSAATAALDQSLEQLFPGDKDAYVDLMLQHFPASWSGEGGPSLRKEQWLAMEAWAHKGKAKALGISHYCARHLDDVLSVATEPVSLNQVQYHVGMGQQNATFCHDPEYMKAKGVVYMSYSSLCGPCPPPDNTELISGDLVTSIGAQHGKTGAQVALRWLVQQGIPVIPKSSSATHLSENFDLFSFTLTAEEMNRLHLATSPVETGTPPQPPDDAQDCSVP